MQTSGQIPKTIPLAAVRIALMAAQVRRLTHPADGKAVGRFAAYSNYPAVNISCTEARRGHKPYRLAPMHAGPMYRGDLRQLLQRVRWQHGLAGVRNTWGAGMRALTTEFADVVLR